MSKLFHKIIEQTLLVSDIEEKNAKVIKKELINNFFDQRDHLISKGVTPKKAEREIVKKFGNPIIIGKLLRNHYFTSKFLKKINVLSNRIGIISVITGFYYGLSTKLLDIKYWSILAILGGILAIIASKTVSQSRLWRFGAIFGFLLLAIGQILPIFSGIFFLNRSFRDCSYSPYLTTYCIRQHEIIIGLGIHIFLFFLCVLVVYEILIQKRLFQFFK